MTGIVRRFLISLPPSPFIRVCLLVLVCTLLQLFVFSRYPLPLSGPQPTITVLYVRRSRASFAYTRLQRPLCFSLYASRVSRSSLSIGYALCFIRCAHLPFGCTFYTLSLPLGGCTLVSLWRLVCSLLSHLLLQHCAATWRYTFVRHSLHSLFCSVCAFTRLLSSPLRWKPCCAFYAFAGLQRPLLISFGFRCARRLRCAQSPAAALCFRLVCVASHRVLAARDVASPARSLRLQCLILVSFTLLLLACSPLMISSQVRAASSCRTLFLFRLHCISSRARRS